MTGMNALVSARNVTLDFPVRERRSAIGPRGTSRIRAIDDVSFDISDGETVGLVGESGCGKSSLGRVLLRLIEPTAGDVLFDGVNLRELSRPALRRARRQMQMVFQNVQAALDPSLKVQNAIREGLDIHEIGTKQERDARVKELLSAVGLDESFASRLPADLSGGQRQRVGIARALATQPRFLVADEPTSALDASVRAQIVNLLVDLKERLSLTYLVIAHDLAMVRHLADRVAVMYLGRIVEIADVQALFERPAHPYTRALLASAPVLRTTSSAEADRVPLRGELPSPLHPPSGCHFRTRCPLATAICAESRPPLQPIESRSPTHTVACFHAT